MFNQSIKLNKSSDNHILQGNRKQCNIPTITESDTSGENQIKLQYINNRLEARSLQEKGINEFSLESNKDINSEIVESSIINKDVKIYNHKQFYVKRKDNMFINQQMNESITIGKNFWQERTKRFGKDIKELEGKLDIQKLFMNMVIHDLRNPAESIKQGLQQAKSQLH